MGGWVGGLWARACVCAESRWSGHERNHLGESWWYVSDMSETYKRYVKVGFPATAAAAMYVSFVVLQLRISYQVLRM